MDVFTKDKRSKIMAAIRSKNTRPEIIVRKYLFSKGFRYRINHPRLPGHPDIVLRKYRTCIFVNGCFWHGHDCPKGHLPKTNHEFWRNKINRNRERDAEEQRKLAAMGWHCITVWECELANDKRDAGVVTRSADADGRTVRSYQMPPRIHKGSPLKGKRSRRARR